MCPGGRRASLVGGWQGGGIECSRRALRLGIRSWPLPTRLLGDRAHGSISRNVPLVAALNHSEELAVEEVLVHFMLSLHVADAHVLHIREISQGFLCPHHLGLCLGRLHLNKVGSLPFTLSAIGWLETLSRDFDNILLNNHPLRIHLSDHISH